MNPAPEVGSPAGPIQNNDSKRLPPT
ncbi:MAG TPA: hypothetical protein K8W01_00160 [Methylorubrum populi]|uniref:Uncharacterized protein n=1 Tax=Methylorubrum populi TaxID=223967 RepID=A0A921DYT9_9HYPH|nr:hypothetical protein [Methylorubrum populi]